MMLLVLMLNGDDIADVDVIALVDDVANDIDE